MEEILEKTYLGLETCLRLEPKCLLLPLLQFEFPLVSGVNYNL